MRRKKVTHFSHHHPLHETTVPEDDQTSCAACELDISGPAYKCGEIMCNTFYLHKSCLELPLEIRHKSHPAHPLTLLSSPAFNAYSFKCDGCGQNGSSFTYNCETCNYDLHVKCATLVESVMHEDHEHPINLCYSMIYDQENTEIVCDVCDGSVQDGCWVYCCKECDFGTHLDCASTNKEDVPDEKESTKAENEEEEEEEAEAEAKGESGTSEPVSSMHALLNAQLENQAHMQRMQFQMNASRQNAQFMNDITRSMRSLY